MRKGEINETQASEKDGRTPPRQTGGLASAPLRGRPHGQFHRGVGESPTNLQEPPRRPIPSRSRGPAQGTAPGRRRSNPGRPHPRATPAAAGEKNHRRSVRRASGVGRIGFATFHLKSDENKTK